jgi:hypothetical protein
LLRCGRKIFQKKAGRKPPASGLNDRFTLTTHLRRKETGGKIVLWPAATGLAGNFVFSGRHEVS